MAVLCNDQIFPPKVTSSNQIVIHLWNGILLGLALSILVGPILFSLIQTSIEQGAKAGLWIGLGIWISDILFIVGIAFGVTHVSQMIAAPMFKPILGVFGGLILIGIGVGMLVSKPLGNMAEEEKFGMFSSRWRLCLEGFSINTFNPFSVVFWTSIITARAVDQSLFSTNNYLFFSGILGTVILTDSLKIFLAKKIRKYLRPIHILWMRKISGGALLIFGIAMIVQVLFF